MSRSSSTRLSSALSLYVLAAHLIELGTVNHAAPFSGLPYPEIETFHRDPDAPLRPPSLNSLVQTSLTASSLNSTEYFRFDIDTLLCFLFYPNSCLLNRVKSIIGQKNDVLLYTVSERGSCLERHSAGNFP